MKRKFSKILGVGLTLSLLISLLLTAAPVSADVSQPTVSLEEEEISVAEDYTISFVLGKELAEGDTITVRFPEDTDVPQGFLNTDSFTVAASPGWIGGSWDITTKQDTITAEGDEDDLTVVFTLLTADKIGEGATVRIEFIAVGTTPIKNPSEPGTYTLEVRTSEEDDWVESEEYDIDAPTVGGFVYVYNPSNILLASFGGRDALEDAWKGGYFGATAEDYTIKVGAGTYDVKNFPIVIEGEGLTLESAEGAEDTIIDVDSACAGPPIRINADDVTVDGFTVDDSPHDGIKIHEGTEGVTVKNNIITDAADSGIMLDDLAGEDVVVEATVSGNVIEDCGAGINLLGSALDCTISGNTITGCSNEGIDIHGGEGAYLTEGNTIEGNTITANKCMGIRIKVAKDEADNGGQLFKDNVIEGNTISENEGNGIEIVVESTVDTLLGDITGLEILSNDIIDNEDDGIRIECLFWNLSNVIKFNTITGNGDDGINNEDVDADVDATFNWWGTTDDDDIEVSDDVTFEPFLTGTAEDTILGGKAAGDTSSLDAKSACGVIVSGVEDDAYTAGDTEIISALQYASNPADDIDDAIAFYDVYIILDTTATATELDEVNAKLKFYDSAINTGSVANFWTGDFWAECSDQLARDGVVYVTLTEDTVPSFEELEGTPFVVVAGEVVEDVFGAPVIAAPKSGADDVILKPTLAWEMVTGAIGYDFELADNTLFVMPMVSLTGDMARLITPFYQQVETLDYSTYYYWRVKAVSADEESVWSSAVFMTMAEPITEPEVPRMWTCPQCGLTYSTRAKLEAHADWAHQPVEPADIIVVPPDIIVPLPDVIETPITPAWIYVIIGVGAVLVIALLVLIVRTRRVA